MPKSVAKLPRWKTISDAIAADIWSGKLSAGETLPAEKVIAENWSVSAMTAHRAMQELQARGMVIRRRRAGTQVAPRHKMKAYSVAVFLNTQDALEQEYLAGIRAGLPDDCDVLLCDIHGEPDREALYLQRMRGRAEGIVCIPTCSPANDELLREIAASETVLVCLDSVPQRLHVDAVISDNYGASAAGMEHLVRCGCTRLVHFTTDGPWDSALSERAAAFQDCAQKHSLDGRVHRFRLAPDGAMKASTAEVYEAIGGAMAGWDGEGALGIFCIHDYVLASVLSALRSPDANLPHAVEVLSFNDCSDTAPHLPGSVHRIVQRAFDMGRMAAERIQLRLCSQDENRTVTRVPPVFVPAGSPNHHPPDTIEEEKPDNYFHYHMRQTDEREPAAPV